MPSDGQNTGSPASFAQTFSIYLDRRMARIALLGLISGFPWVLIGSALTLWLKEDGLSRTAIGWAGLIFGVYAINFLWAPLIDRIQIPLLTARLGHRRAWIVTLQAVILICLTLWSIFDPVTNEVTNIKIIGRKFMSKIKYFFLSFKSNLIFIFLIIK